MHLHFHPGCVEPVMKRVTTGVSEERNYGRRETINEANISAEQSEEKQKVWIQKTNEHQRWKGDSPQTQEKRKKETDCCR